MVLTRIFRRKKVTGPPPSMVPEGRRIYAIGDIHGRADLFDRMIEAIRRDDGDRDPADTTLILLGDLVDRGPDSRGVIERAMALRDEFADLRWIVGNHEEVFLKALGGDPKLVRYFVRIGGGPTIRSYGLPDEEYERMEFEELAAALPQLVPPAHVDFLHGGEDSVEIGDYLFVHAGINPALPLDRQVVGDLRWIRDEFLCDSRHHGRVIVHGHTITEEVENLPNRIGVDTGAYASGRLTAVVLEGSERRFLQAAEAD